MKELYRVQDGINREECPLGQVKGKGERWGTPIKYAPIEDEE